MRPRISCGGCDACRVHCWTCLCNILIVFFHVVVRLVLVFVRVGPSLVVVVLLFLFFITGFVHRYFVVVFLVLVVVFLTLQI